MDGNSGRPVQRSRTPLREVRTVLVDARTSRRRAGALTLAELTEAADVSVRTVRYYIAEGLLPPPEGSGPGSAYARGHLDRCG